MTDKPQTRTIMALLPALLLAALAAAQVPGNEDEILLSGDAAWKLDLLKEREQKDAEFKASVTSPMAGCERLTVTPGARAYVLADGDGARVSDKAEDGAAFSLLFRDGSWYWDDAAPGVACRLGERAIASMSEALPPGCLFSAGRLTLVGYPGPEAFVLVVFDPRRPQIAAFERLLYFPPDPRYAVKARLERFPRPQPLKVATTRRLEKTFYRFGRVRFQVEGRALELTALKTSLEGPGSEYLFIPFKDDTNGKETYEVGRFLDAAEPQGDEFILDFNRCYNPLCNYSPAYNCPLPPLENILDIEIRAGEKTYPHEE